MIILVDTNIALDFLTMRQPFIMMQEKLSVFVRVRKYRDLLHFIVCPIFSTF